MHHRRSGKSIETRKVPHYPYPQVLDFRVSIEDYSNIYSIDISKSTGSAIVFQSLFATESVELNYDCDIYAYLF